MAEVSREHIEIVEGAGGPKARILGHRIRVQDVAVWHEKLGMTADEIVNEYPTITLADVYAALAYYWDHREEIEGRIQEDATFAEELSKHAPSILAKKLAQLSG
ncbi:MAG: hypothetical protein QOF51_3343 [Chloroflexota bacterium]|nr:hypothetical protein [Chloroflexota bacterium]